MVACIKYLNKTMRPILIITFLLLTLQIFGQKHKQILQFNKADYPISKYVNLSDTSYLSQIKIVFTMSHPIKNSDANFSCRSWLTILKNNKVLTTKFYDIEAVGGCAGLYKPTIQPCKNYFILSKFGDYAGQTLIIDTNGKLTILIGGSFSISTDKHYLFATYDSDVSGITIYDLKNKKIILSKESNGEERFNEFYFEDGTYLVSMEQNSSSKEMSVGLLDIKNKKLTMVKKPNSFLKNKHKLKMYNEVQSLSRCNCGQ